MIDFTGFIRHALEMCMLFPALCFSLIPAQPFSRLSRPKLWLTALLEACAVIAAGSWVCVRYGIRSEPILLVSLILFFPSMLLSVRLSVPKTAFCIVNGLLISVVVNFYTCYLTAPREADTEITFSPLSSGICVLLAFFLLLVAFSTLKDRMPILFQDERLDRIWLPAGLSFLFLSVLLLWVLPRDSAELLLPHARRTVLIVFPLVPLFFFLLYYLLWWIETQLTETAAVEQENSLLHLESKRYEELNRYMDETRVLRHDYRQHLHVMSELARRGETEELVRYLDTLEQQPYSRTRFCGNPAVDAIAAHYAGIAEQQETKIDWTLELPETLPMKESEFCAMLGNLLDNSLSAVRALAPEQRNIRVTVRMLSDRMLGLSVENPYTGRVRMGIDGFPVRRKNDRGIGLHSVAATVKQYGGSMDIGTENGFFTVNILLYLPSP